MHLIHLSLVTAALVPSCLYAFALSSTTGVSFARHGAPLGRLSSPAPTLDSRGVLAFSSFARGGRGGKSGRDGTGSVARRRTGDSSRRSRFGRLSAVMSVEVVPVLGGAEAAAAAFAGHIPGVVVGVATVLWSTVAKEWVADAGSVIKPVGGAIGSVLTFLTVVMLGVRVFTAPPDGRYTDAFPTGIAHPQGCTRVAPEGGNKGIAVPTFSSSTDEVQGEAKAWLESQPRTKIVTDVPGYVHAKSLSLLFGFPDSVGVKVFKNGSGKTEMWVQSELRVGQGDLDVNYKRVEAFLGHMGKTLK